LRVKQPNSFRTDRSPFGADINKVFIPAIVKPLLAQRELRRAPGSRGQIACGKTPVPVKLSLEFDSI
jgi:hypothetical protein